MNRHRESLLIHYPSHPLKTSYRIYGALLRFTLYQVGLEKVAAAMLPPRAAQTQQDFAQPTAILTQIRLRVTDSSQILQPQLFIQPQAMPYNSL